MSDWPQDKPPPYPRADDEAEVFPPCETTWDTIARSTHLTASPPPPDVWEFYRRHGRWPEPGEA